MSLDKLSVGARLGMAFGLMLVLIASIASVGLFNASRLNDGMTEIVDAKVPKMVAAGDLSTSLLKAAQDLRDVEDAPDAQGVRQYLDLLARHQAERRAIIDDLTRTLVKPKGIAALKVINAVRQPFELREAEFVKLTNAGDRAGATALVPGMRPLQEAYLDAVYKLVVINRDVIVHSMEEARETYGMARTTALVLLAASLAAGLTTALWMSRSLLRQLGGEPSEAAALAHAVSSGDLTTPVHLRPGDEHSLMAQLAGMQTRLASVVQSVRSGADGVATASLQIASGNNDLSSRTEQQAGALEQTASSMAHFGTTVRENAENARQANQLAIDATAVAVRGGTVVGQVVDTMHGINDSSRRIADIIGVIDGIAFQTNILALNAAVEAARAGEQGRGFAVVASEVRSLAQRSADAAREIKSLINASVERVEQGSTLVDSAGSTMKEVVDSIKRLNEIVAQITTASADQNDGVEQVGHAVREMDRSTQQNAAMVEQSAAAAESLKGQAAQLVQTVAVFKLASP